jgi:hypothetical protein
MLISGISSRERRWICSNSVLPRITVFKTPPSGSAPSRGFLTRIPLATFAQKPRGGFFNADGRVGHIDKNGDWQLEVDDGIFVWTTTIYDWLKRELTPVF